MPLPKIDNFYLSQLPKNLRYLIALFLATLSFGIILGLIYVFTNTGFSFSGIENHYGKEKNIQLSNEFSDDLEIEKELQKELQNNKEYQEKGLKQILTTTHNHVLSLAIIFFIISLLVYFTETQRTLKKILMFEPFISIFLTFSGIIAVRYVHSSFKFVVAISSTILYVVYFISLFILLKELLKTKYTKKTIK